MDLFDRVHKLGPTSRLRDGELGMEALTVLSDQAKLNALMREIAGAASSFGFGTYPIGTLAYLTSLYGSTHPEANVIVFATEVASLFHPGDKLAAGELASQILAAVSCTTEQ